MMLLVGAGLLAASLWKVLRVDPGFRPERLLTLRVTLPASKYDETGPIVAFFRRLPEHLQALPGVASVTAVSSLPISGGDALGEVTVEGLPLAQQDKPSASFRRVLPGYFRTLGIPLRAGRDFTVEDDGTGPFVVIVTESLARRLWPDEDAIGRRLKVGPIENEPWLTVVGVAADVRHVGLDQEPSFATYEPHAQRPRTSMRAALRSWQAPEGLAASVQAALRRLEPEVIVDQTQTMEDRIAGSVAPRRLQALLIAGFAAAALALAAVGLFGVVAHSVGQRTREIGVRMALGARRADVLRMVIGEGMALAGSGAALGVVGAAFASRLLTTFLYGVQPADPLVLAGATGLLLLIALAACAAPAARATRVDPAEALRHD